MEESSGVRLKKIRLEKGLTLEEVRKKTNIHLNILKAIEEDSLVGFNPVYLKGFLKIYCRCLGVDPKDYIVGYQEPPVQAKEILPPVAGGPLPFLKIASAKLNFLKDITKKIKAMPIFILIITVALAIALFNLGKRTQKPRAKVAPEARPSETAVSKKEVSSGIRLGMRAKADCWVQLKADGRVVFRAVLKKGAFETWVAKEKMELSLGNAGGVELELNSKPIPSLGRRGQVIKNILITKEQGLVVGR